MNQLIQLKTTPPLLITLALLCFGLLPRAQAACDSPDPGCPGGNLAEGYLSLAGLAGGAAYNTGIGAYSLLSNTTGGLNTGVGGGTLFSNVDAIEGTAVGAGALFSSNASNNTAVGAFALFSDTTGGFNNAVGANAMLFNVDGFRNNALGESALSSNIHAASNTAIGDAALKNNDSSGNNTANLNTAVGASALEANIDGGANTAIGSGALLASTGDFNIAVGANAGTDPGIASNNVYIGDPGFPGDENVISIGGIAASGTDYAACYIGGISGAEVNTGTAFPVYVDSLDGHLGTVLVNANGIRSAAPLRRGKGVQPQARFNHKVGKLEATATQQQKQIAHQQKQISQQQTQIEVLAAQLKEQAAQIQKVSAQLETSKPAPQVVNNP